MSQIKSLRQTIGFSTPNLLPLSTYFYTILVLPICNNEIQIENNDLFVVILSINNPDFMTCKVVRNDGTLSAEQLLKKEVNDLKDEQKNQGYTFVKEDEVIITDVSYNIP